MGIVRAGDSSASLRMTGGCAQNDRKKRSEWGGPPPVCHPRIKCGAGSERSRRIWVRGAQGVGIVRAGGSSDSLRMTGGCAQNDRKKRSEWGGPPPVCHPRIKCGAGSERSRRIWVRGAQGVGIVRAGGSSDSLRMTEKWAHNVMYLPTVTWMSFDSSTYRVVRLHCLNVNRPYPHK